jgi:serine/threonine protein kinase
MGNNASYDIKTENKIGKGSFAVVYKVKKPGSLELCAAKVYNVPISMMLAREQQGYERELRILKTVNHPFVIRYIEEFVY